MYGTDLETNIIDDIMKAADTNNDGEVELGEFMAIMRAQPAKK